MTIRKTTQRGAESLEYPAMAAGAATAGLLVVDGIVDNGTTLTGGINSATDAVANAIGDVDFGG